MKKKAQEVVAEEVGTEIMEDDIFGGPEPAEADASGNRYLPGAEPLVIKEIVELVTDIELTKKPEFAAARDALLSAQAELSEACHRNIEHFTPLDDNNTRTYAVALDGRKIEVKITLEKEKIKTKLKDEDTDLDDE